MAIELDLERLAIVALALADIALDVDVGEEVHLDLDQAVAGARFAAAALDVEREAAGLVAARLAFGQPREPIADLGEGAGISRRVRARGAADRRLIDVDHLVEKIGRAQSELQSLMRISYAGFCLNKKKHYHTTIHE